MQFVRHPAAALLLCLFTTGVFLAATHATVHAADWRLKGWEQGSAYDALYIPADREKFTAVIEKVIDITPMPGMDEGVGLIAKRDDTGEKVTVHIGPKDFVTTRSDWAAVTPGAKAKIYGVYNDLADKEIFLLNKIVVGDKMVKVRKTGDGRGWWTLTPEELAKEEADNKAE
ncbi:hypothetical protein [Megalodesulfovibrio gigas]|uniref:hypothetical protein n=1 Tax=Megalodesulfovibrio gigas TaxID=879 RepID=UPI000684D2DE|nr:hypothetical protein [Megalodesulfovibrio gigas]